MHGRSVPRSGRDLLDDFSAALARWDWDVTLLQEVPPWWPATLARRLGAEYRQVLTSRNALLGLRRELAQRWPDVLKSQGGGANAILARRDRIVVHHVQRLCRVPERRVAHGVLLGCGIWVVNLHATAHDTSAADRDGTTAVTAALQWGGGDPLVLGGDFNLRTPHWPGFVSVADSDVDHILIAGALQASSEAEILDRGVLSDHAPVAVDIRLATDEAGVDPDV
jgi:endonuclease/exonuclease/phosphatase family metal-dependent hydrolase